MATTRSTIHDIRNQLAVAIATVEAFVDGKLAPTPDRFARILQALAQADALLDDLREEAKRSEPT